MRRAQTAQQLLKLTTANPVSQQYICRTCLAQVARQIHTSTPRNAELPFGQRMRNLIFGSGEAQAADESRERARKRRLDEISAGERNASAVKTDKQGREYQIAAVVDPSINPAYVPADTWQGLEFIGSEQWVKARADKGEEFTGFLPSSKTQLTNLQWRKLLHHIAVEVLTLHNAGRKVTDVCGARNDNTNTKPATANVMIAVKAGSIALQSTSTKTEKRILTAIRNPSKDEQMLSQESLQAELERAIADDVVLQSVEGNHTEKFWMNMDVRDPKIKFAITKRAMQLTGCRLPDPAISAAKTLADLYYAFRTKEKPKKLVETPQLQRLNEQLSNVTIHSSRRTYVHKEKAVGRWKVIENELIARDLPIFGTNWSGVREETKPEDRPRRNYS